MNPDILQFPLYHPSSKTPQHISQVEDHREKERWKIERDKAVGELSAAHIVRHLVSAQSVIIVSAKAGLQYNNRASCKGSKNISSFHCGQRAGVLAVDSFKKAR